MFPQRKKKTLTLKVHAFFKANLSLDCLEKVLYSLIMEQIIVQRRKVIWTTSQQSMHHSFDHGANYFPGPPVNALKI